MCVSDMSILMPSEDDLSNTDWIAFPEESITQLFLPFSIIQQEMSQGTFFWHFTFIVIHFFPLIIIPCLEVGLLF